MLDEVLTDYTNVNDYMDDVFSFLVKYEWIYNFQLTKFIIERVWEKIPLEWRDPLENLTLEQLNSLPDGYIDENWPESLKSFISVATRLSVTRSQTSDLQPVMIDKELRVGMNPKKQHEVSFLAALVEKKCTECQCHLAVDVGAGLGYLGQVLHKKSGLKIVALESIENRTHGAENRQTKQALLCSCIQTKTFELVNTKESVTEFSKVLHSLNWPPSCQCVNRPSSSRHRKHTRRSIESVTKAPSSVQTTVELVESVPRVEETDYHSCKNDILLKEEKGVFLQEHIESNGSLECTVNFAACQRGPSAGVDADKGDVHYLTAVPPTENICMIGLHCCGDLTPTMLHVFLQQPEFRCLVCVSCCYHAMSITDNQFNNFPMSKAVIQAMDRTCKQQSQWNLNTFAMRLAAQETRARWKKQTVPDHEFHTKNVAYRALLQYCIENDGLNMHKIKRKVARKSDYLNFDAYLQAVTNRTSLRDEDFEHIHESMKKAYDLFQKNFTYIEIITALQVLVQPVLESLILLDRVFFLQENGVTASLVPVFDEEISPRNMAIVAHK